MKIRTAAVLLAIASTSGLATPAFADPPGAQVRGMDSTAPNVPTIETSSVVQPERRVVKRNERRSKLRKVAREKAGREHARHRRAVPAEDRQSGMPARPLIVHHDGWDPGIELVANVPGSRLVAEARRWIGTNPTARATLWCARFMNFVLERLGLPGTESDVAKSFASYGKRLEGPKVGAIAVMNRGKSGGHVGVVSGFDKDGDPIIISGNYSRRVAEAVYERSRIIAYVSPDI